MKKIIKLSLIPLISIIILSILFSIINLFMISIPKIIYLISTIIIFIISGYLLGKEYTNKVYLKGLLLGISYSILFILTSIITFKYNNLELIYYLIIVSSSTFGSMYSNIKKK